MKQTTSRSRTFKTRQGIRILQHGTVISEVRQDPGPTHSVADLLAAITVYQSPGPHVALLGFAGGGMLAPLRVMGGSHQIDAVDICDEHYSVFQKLCRHWCGDVRFHHEDALNWLKLGRGRFDMILEDLSIPQNADVIKPAMVWEQLPRLIRSRLAKHGLAVFNLLRPPNRTWSQAMSGIMEHYVTGYQIQFEEYENRILVAGPMNETIRTISLGIRHVLRSAGSELADRIAVRSLS